jgi:hypothetical protein
MMDYEFKMQAIRRDNEEKQRVLKEKELQKYHELEVKR